MTRWGGGEAERAPRKAADVPSRLLVERFIVRIYYNS
jgi:hypothetical protein